MKLTDVLRWIETTNETDRVALKDALESYAHRGQLNQLTQRFNQMFGASLNQMTGCDQPWTALSYDEDLCEELLTHYSCKMTQGPATISLYYQQSGDMTNGAFAISLRGGMQAFPKFDESVLSSLFSRTNMVKVLDCPDALENLGEDEDEYTQPTQSISFF